MTTDDIWSHWLKDLFRLCRETGFLPVTVTTELNEGSLGPRDWEGYLKSPGNPLIPTIEEALAKTLNADERRRFEEHFRPLVEQGRGTWRGVNRYVVAVKQIALMLRGSSFPKVSVVAAVSLAVAITLLGCGREAAVKRVGPFSIMPFRQPTAEECASERVGILDASPVYPTIVQTEGIQRSAPDLLLPRYLPSGLVFKELRILDQSSVLRYESADESGGLSLVLTIFQGPVPPQGIRVEVADDLYEPVTVGGRDGLVVRGIHTITTEIIDDTRRVTKCEWRPDAQVKLVVPMHDRVVTIIAGPPGHMAADELIRIAESLAPGG